MSTNSNTTLLAVIHRGEIYFAADSRITHDDGIITTLPVSKIQVHGNNMIMSTGDSFVCHMVNSLVNKIGVFKDTLGLPVMIANKLRHHLDELGFEHYPPNENNSTLVDSILFTHGYTFVIHVFKSHVTVEYVSLPFALGCGGQLALGAFEMVKLIKPNTQDIKSYIHYALDIAARHNPGCDGNSTIESIKL